MYQAIEWYSRNPAALAVTRPCAAAPRSPGWCDDKLSARASGPAGMGDRGNRRPRRRPGPPSGPPRRARRRARPARTSPAPQRREVRPAGCRPRRPRSALAHQARHPPNDGRAAGTVGASDSPALCRRGSDHRSAAGLLPRHRRPRAAALEAPGERNARDDAQRRAAAPAGRVGPGDPHHRGRAARPRPPRG